MNMKNQERVPTLRSITAAKLPLSNLLLLKKPKLKQSSSNLIYKFTDISLFSNKVRGGYSLCFTQEKLRKTKLNGLTRNCQSYTEAFYFTWRKATMETLVIINE